MVNSGYLNRVIEIGMLDTLTAKIFEIEFEQIGIVKTMDNCENVREILLTFCNFVCSEPTESEDKAELDRFCDALISIRKEVR